MRHDIASGVHCIAGNYERAKQRVISENDDHDCKQAAGARNLCSYLLRILDPIHRIIFI